MLKCLNDIETNFEIFRLCELKALKDLRVPAERIVSSIPVKTTDFIIESYKYGICYFVFKYIDELEMYAKESKKILKIYLLDLDSESCQWGATEEQIISLKESNYDLFKK